MICITYQVNYTYSGFFFFFKQKTAYEIYQCDWSSDVCSSDLQLQKAMMKAVETAIEDANVILYLVEANEILNQIDREYLLKFKEGNVPVLVLLNKIDLVQKNKVLPLMENLFKEIQPDEIIPISALKNDGINDVMDEIVKRLPESPPYYPEDLLTEHPERFFVSEIIREKIFYHYGEEIPYSTTVVIDEYKEIGRAHV